MAKPLRKPAKPESETAGPPDLMLVDKPRQQDPKQPEAAPAAQRTKKSQAMRALHPARVWPD